MWRVLLLCCGTQRQKKKKKQSDTSKAPPPSTVVAPVAEPNKEDEKPEEEEDQEDTPGSAIAGAASDELQARAAARAGEVDAEGGVATTSAGFSNVSVNRDLFEIIYARAKILLSFMQIFSGFSMALEINWPPALKNLMKSFTFVNIDLSDIFGGIDACSFTVPFLTSFGYHMVLLPALIVMIVLGALVAKCIFGRSVTRTVAVARAAHLINLVVFVLFPGLCAKVFAALKCKQIGAKSYLVADFSVECWVGEHAQRAALAFACLLVYVLGIPMLTLGILRCNRAHLYDESSPKHETLMLSVGSLYSSYEPQYYYWEVVEMMRKMLLTGAVQMVGAGTSAQALFAILICLAHMLFVLRTAPFEDDVDDVLQFSSALSLSLTLLMGMTLDADKGGDVYDRALMGALLVTINIAVGVIGLLGLLSTLPCFGSVMERILAKKGSYKRIKWSKERSM